MEHWASGEAEDREPSAAGQIHLLSVRKQQ